MLQSIHFSRFAQYLFDTQDLARKAGVILQAILAAQSPRLSEIAEKMPGKSDANYKQLQRFLAQVDLPAALRRLFQTDAPFVIGDPTEMPRPQAYRTPYVGLLKDGKTRGFWLLMLATPFRGRALPFGYITYSSKTIATEESSRTFQHYRAFETLKDLVGDKPLVLDREFSYLELLEALVVEQVHFVIRLKLGSQSPHLYDEHGQTVILSVAQGETAIQRRLWYKGRVRVNVIGIWQKGFSEPLWVMTDLKAEQGLDIYFQRMKIEESFRDLKNLLRLDKLMNKRQAQMEKMVALVLLAFSIGLLTGEGLRDALYAEPTASLQPVPPPDRVPGQPHLRQGRKWKLYSGLFILLKQKIVLPGPRLRALVHAALLAFRELVQHPVRTYV